MEKTTINVTQGVYKTSKEARNANRIPMVYYGKGIESTNFSADYQDFRRIYKKAGKSTIITLVNEDKKEFHVLVHDIQYHPVSDKIMHVDLMAVDLNKRITTKVPLVFVGQSAAVKEEGGILVTSKDTVNVECLPKDLVHEIEVDISPLADFNSVIKVRDLKIPNGIKILDAGDINVANVSAPRSEAELEALEKEVTAPSEVIVGEEAKEGEEGGEAEEGEGEKKERKKDESKE